jgi:uncharacterized membrane protein (UPF0127 family)
MLRAWLALIVGLALLGCGRGEERPARALAAYDASARAPTSTTQERTAAVTLTPPGKSPVRVSVELARTEEQRARGLMYRQHLPMDRGMLFLFSKDEIQSFWMKNTLIPLDLIFIKSDLTVAGVVENAEPMTQTPRSVASPSRYVLEVNGGYARQHGIAAGTPVAFDEVPLP